jgi:hypothetical protein
VGRSHHARGGDRTLLGLPAQRWLMSTIARHLGKECGFSCQAWLAADIAQRYFRNSHRTWFSTSINPPHNGGSSNPLLLYQELERVTYTNDYNNSRIDQLRNRLFGWISGSTLHSNDVANLLVEIAAAPIIAFRPQLWRIDLRNIHVSRLVNLGQFPDEYQIRDVIAPEYQVFA